MLLQAFLWYVAVLSITFYLVFDQNQLHSRYAAEPPVSLSAAHARLLQPDGQAPFLYCSEQRLGALFRWKSHVATVDLLGCRVRVRATGTRMPLP
jgi:hypothetical protein